MTLDEKAAQTIQAERAQITNAQVMQYGVGSIYSQGGSSPSTNTPAGWAAMISAYRTASRASAHGIPIIYGLDSVHGLGPVAGATVFPHNVGLGAIGDPAFIEQVTRVVADESAGWALTSVRARRGRQPGRAVGTDVRVLRRDARSRVGAGRRDGERPASPYCGGSEDLDPGKPQALRRRWRHPGRRDGRAGHRRRGDAARDAPRALLGGIAAHAGSVMLSYSSWQGVKMHINKPMITDVLKARWPSADSSPRTTTAASRSGLGASNALAGMPQCRR
jgi:beta-glucosidase